MAFQTLVERNCWLLPYLAIQNNLKRHMDLAGSTPVQQLELIRASE